MTENEKQLHDQAYQAVVQKGAKVQADPYRQTYHLMPPVGLLNDPNGWVQWKGTYHMFFQWNPFSPDHTHKFWGHYTSEDLVSWNEEKIALAPSEWYEKNGCYSGSAIEKDGELALLYTGNVKDENDERESYQCLAVSSDGISFEKKGPVVDSLPEGYTAHFRDPKVWKENGVYYFVIGAQTEELKGQVLLYKSADFKQWKYAGPFAGSGLNGLGDFGYMWECPDLFSLNGRDILVVSPQGLETKGHDFENVYQSGYFLGEADLEAGSFSHGDFQELDQGFEFYAPQTTVDDTGRRILVGWMGVPDSDEEFQPTVQNEWVHCLTIPRMLEVKNNKVYQQPVPELKKLRGDEPLQMKVNTAFGAEVALTPASEIEIDCEEAEELKLSIREEISLYYDPEKKLLQLSRPRFRDGATETRSCSVAQLSRLHIYLDHSSIEVFINDGESVMSARFFPDPEIPTVQISGGEGRITWSSWELS
ncbi:sucrose-6-phosphate hydrolase [Alkalicoccus daliensis]|uniref:Sucrose-6-phosphate hydrolase n=1 Tax=Alkalicoccus daliensis TaxID=745820 RepID=A0A1H0K4C3_9BACI|nr:sucrose-6-phosphate hydrolase [Alkalicoccus daliensis]SDO50726.1 beta-fructofuranosidase [Alkalicoccus daliensis]